MPPSHDKKDLQNPLEDDAPLSEQSYLEMVTRIVEATDVHPAILANRTHIIAQLVLASQNPCHPQNRALLTGVRLLMHQVV